MVAMEVNVKNRARKTCPSGMELNTIGMVKNNSVWLRTTMVVQPLEAK